MISTRKHNDKASTYDFIGAWLGDGLLTARGKQYMQSQIIYVENYFKTKI